VADEPEDKPDGDVPARETVVGHPVVEAEQSSPPPQPAAAPQPPTSGGTSPAAADRQAAEDHDPFTEKPELFIGGAFVGAFVFAKLLKKLTGGGD
jgi:hypothetical protein